MNQMVRMFFLVCVVDPAFGAMAFTFHEHNFVTMNQLGCLLGLSLRGHVGGNKLLSMQFVDG